MTHERLYSVGTKIKEIRESKGMTCTELAEKVGVGKQHVYKIERDIIKHQPYSTIKAYADALNVNPAYLVGWSNSIERTPDIITEGVNSDSLS
jgi:transcriptional regulator with XRE-family HTH domain